MNRVSKSIKKYRIADGMTQNELSEKLFVSRQTVSSWESGRTQPDIEMLVKLSEALGVSIEELIYGEKPKTVDDGNNEKSRKILTLIFSVLASALVGVGAVLVFVNYWSEFPQGLQTVFSFLPMLAGQAAAVWVFIKKYNRVPWREGAAVLWCAGVAATVALTDSVMNLNTDFYSCALADIIMFLPVIYIMNAVAPLLVYYVLSVVYIFQLYESVSSDGLRIAAALAAMLALFAGGAVYVYIHRRETEDVRHSYSVWITAAAYTAFAVITGIVFSELFPAVFGSMMLLIYMLKQNADDSLPFTVFSRLGLAVCSVISSIIISPGNGFTGIPEPELGDKLFAVFSVCILAASLVLFIIKRKKSVTQVIWYFTSAAVPAVMLLASFGYFQNDVRYIIFFIVIVAQGVSLVLSGAKENNFFSLNVGLITIAAMLMEFVFSQEADTLITGIILIILGAILFTVNYALIRKSKKDGGKNE
ncbi:MAG: DUF2157 domain-containing protein [Clostridia bacterium]|nr:DUF2157 domain-containing protein [Clostridia bacterium]